MWQGYFGLFSLSQKYLQLWGMKEGGGDLTIAILHTTGPVKPINGFHEYQWSTLWTWDKNYVIQIGKLLAIYTEFNWKSNYTTNRHTTTNDSWIIILIFTDFFGNKWQSTNNVIAFMLVFTKVKHKLTMYTRVCIISWFDVNVPFPWSVTNALTYLSLC